MPRTLSTRTLLVVVAGFILFISPQAVVGLAAAGKPSLPNAATGAQLSKVMVFMFENNSQAVAYAGMPTLVSLAAQYGKATNYTGVTHPSEGNYVTILSGQGYATCGLADPTPPECAQPGGTVFGKGIAAGKTARIYQEDMDPACTASADYGHNPWLFFPAEASQCQQNDLPMGTTTSGSLFTDIHNGALPNASMVVPNDCNNAHSCALSTADAWLKSWLSVVFAGPDWTSGHLAVVVTFDEGETTEDVAFVVASPTVPAGTVFTAASDHYSLSRLYAEVLGVAPMNGATSATDLAAPFNLGGTGPLPTPTPTPSPSPSPSASPSPSPLPGPGGFFPKGLFRFGATDFSAMTGAGFNAVTDGNDPTTLNTLGANGLKGLVWLGQYNNSTCAWDSSDSQVASTVDSVKGNPNILAYQIGDEPNHFTCPGAPSQFSARTALIHQHDPSGLSYTTSDEFNDRSQTPTTSVFKGTVDILGFDIYPCDLGQATCNWAMIDRAVPVIQSMQLPRWWAVMQDFQDNTWRWPTATELTQQFSHWANSGMTGYLVFAWDYLGNHLTGQAGNAAAWTTLNATTPTPSPSPSPTPLPAIRGQYHPVAPARILDTRDGTGPVTPGPLGPGQTLTFPVTGKGGVPATGVSAVVLNVTVTDTTAASYLTLYPAGQPRPLASNLNWVTGQTVPNLVEVAVGSGGQVSIFNASGWSDVIFDVAGYASAPLPTASADGWYNPVVPGRVLDTRDGTGGVPSAPLGAGQSLTLTVVGQQGVPATGVSAVVLNVTVTNPTASGYLTVFPTSGTRPVVSNLNFVAGQTVPNRVIVKVGTGGQVSFYNYAGTADVVADVGGWFTDGTNAAATGSGFTGMTPVRVLDTRAGTGGFFSPMGGSNTISATIAGVSGIPAMSATAPPVAVVLNVTVTNATAGSYLTLWPDAATQPLASDLNFVAGQTVPNLVVVKLGANGNIDIFNFAGSTDVVVDVVGWYN